MNPIESNWFRERLDQYILPGGAVLNIGSSTKDYRERVEPHISENIFRPLAERDVQVLHVDLKSADGVDVVGDITDPQFVHQLRQMNAAAVLCNNLLEHIENRTSFARALVEIMIPGSALFVSVPNQYPFHPDPIDTMYRPNVEELASLFPKLTMVEGMILSCGSHREMQEYYRRAVPRKWRNTRLKRTAKLFMPFYKPATWLNMATGRDRAHWDSSILVTVCIFRK